jgi:hypothetical protein
MQLTPRYLVNNKTVIVLDETGFTVEYRPVYQRNLQVYKGIDNKLQFQVKNADQRPVNISSYTPKFIAFDENENMVLDLTGTVLDDGSSLTRGTFSVTITENSLLNLNQQYLTYNIYMIDEDSEKILTYANEWFDATGIIFLSARAFPGAKASQSVTRFVETGQDTSVWVSDPIDAFPALNGNEALHTAVVYSTAFLGDVTVQGTLDNQITNETVWADVATITVDDVTEPSYSNFNGVLSFIRFQTTSDPSTITKILVRI